jgi:hypothetical protein
MKYLLALAILLTGCSTTVPVKMTFPDIPDDLKTSCEALEKIPADTKQLSVTSEVIVRNYSKYHGCKVKVDAWQEWHKTQKQIYESVK